MRARFEAERASVTTPERVLVIWQLRTSRQEFFDMAADFFLGESLVGDGNEVAHIDLIIGSKTGPAGTAFCNALANNKDGFTTLLAVVAPNLPAKPDTLLFNKVTIKGAKQAVQMFGPAQAAVARAVVDSVESLSLIHISEPTRQAEI